MWEQSRNRGSATLEVTMVLPIVLVIIVLLISFLIHLYDRSVISVAACQGAMQLYYEEGNSNSAIKNRCIAKAEEVLADHLVGTDSPRLIVEVSRFKVKVRAEAESELMPLRLFGLDFEELLPGLETDWEINRFSQTEFIRNVRKAKVIYEWGKGFADSEKGGINDSGRIQEGTGPQLSDFQNGQ